MSKLLHYGRALFGKVLYKLHLALGKCYLVTYSHLKPYVYREFSDLLFNLGKLNCYNLGKVFQPGRKVPFRYIGSVFINYPKGPVIALRVGVKVLLQGKKALDIVLFPHKDKACEGPCGSTGSFFKWGGCDQ